MKVTLSTEIANTLWAMRENKIAKYFNIHKSWSYDTDATDMLYHMREAIAGYAKKNNLKIDVYNPQELEKSMKSDINMDLPQISPNIGLVVTNRKTGKFVTEIIDADTSKTYPKESVKTILIPIKGEEDMQIARKVKSTTTDNFLRHVFRTIENMNKSVSDK